MPTKSETLSRWESGWTFRFRPSIAPPPTRIILFIHGWTGDEFSLDPFSHTASPQAVLFFPRGPVKASPSGFGWANHTAPGGTTFASFEPAAHALMKFLEAQVVEMDLPNLPFTLVGFSQGVAMSITLAALYPNRIAGLALLAGFLPQQMPPQSGFDLTGKHVFVAHGRKDQVVPIQEAHNLITYLENAGATIEFCESNAGHKLSSACFPGLNRFLA